MTEKTDKKAFEKVVRKHYALKEDHIVYWDENDDWPTIIFPIGEKSVKKEFDLFISGRKSERDEIKEKILNSAINTDVNSQIVLERETFDKIIGGD